MDIATRLRQFIDYRKISVSQFADTCGIPRPSFSQLLSGRNKKVSDELIGKIHDAFPALSVMWLMFGEGNMLTDANIETSEPENTPELPFNESIASDYEEFMLYGKENNAYQQREPEKYEAIPYRTAPRKQPSPEAQQTPAPSEISFIDTSGMSAGATSSSGPSAQSQQKGASEAKRKVSHIIVYYNDNTFETFLPQSAGH